MDITIFGTCRLSNITSNNLNNLITYTHCTKEVIQYIKFLKGELDIPSPYNTLCFRTAICLNKKIEYNKVFTDIFLYSKIFIIEICSAKKYIHRDFYLQHLSVDKKSELSKNTPLDILDFTFEKQSDEEIENDILEIQQLLHPRKIIIVSHYNSKCNGKYLSARNDLIQLLETICRKHSIYFINPTFLLDQEQSMQSDLGHYTQLGMLFFTRYLNLIIQMHNINE